MAIRKIEQKIVKRYSSETKVMIGMPVYNGEKYIRQALDSILEQTYQDFEIIVSDNASHDNTMKICIDYAKKDPRIHLLRNEHNMGAAYNYNQLVTLSDCQYFKWASCDDIIAPSFLENCLKQLEMDNLAVLAYAQTVTIDGDGEISGIYNDEMNLFSNVPYHRVKEFEKKVGLCNQLLGLIRHDALINSNLIGSYVGSDIVLLLELLLKGKFIKIDEPLFYRRNHEGNIRKLPLKERAKWFDTSYEGNIHKYPNLYLFVKKLQAIYASGMNTRDKLMCYPQIGWWVLQKWHDWAGKQKARVLGAIQKALTL